MFILKQQIKTKCFLDYGIHRKAPSHLIFAHNQRIFLNAISLRQTRDM